MINTGDRYKKVAGNKKNETRIIPFLSFCLDFITVPQKIIRLVVLSEKDQSPG